MTIMLEQSRENQKEASSLLLEAISADCSNLYRRGLTDDINSCVKLEFRGLLSLEDSGYPRLRRVYQEDIDPIVAEHLELID